MTMKSNIKQAKKSSKPGYVDISLGETRKRYRSAFQSVLQIGINMQASALYGIQQTDAANWPELCQLFNDTTTLTADCVKALDSVAFTEDGQYIFCVTKNGNAYQLAMNRDLFIKYALHRRAEKLI